jgi:hypothetical protein
MQNINEGTVTYIGFSDTDEATDEIISHHPTYPSSGKTPRYMWGIEDISETNVNTAVPIAFDRPSNQTPTESVSSDFVILTMRAVRA